MRYAGKVLRWLGTALAAVLFLLVVVFALLQTQIGKQWLEKEIARTASSPDFTVTVGRLGGIVPFRMTIERIEIGDRDGVYLTVRDIGVDISATALLAGQAHIRSLSIAEIEMARISTAPSTRPFTDYLTVPRLPVGVALDRLSIGRLTLAPPVLGEQLVAAIDGSAELIRATAHIALDLHRIDGSAGNITLAVELAGAPPVLSVRLDAADPTGLLADRLFGRTDRQPLALALHGAGLVTDWHGRMSASAGAVARFDADLTLAAAAKTVLGVSATATLTPLLPAEFAPLAGDPITLSLRATFGERLIVNLRSLETAAGTLTGDAEFGRTDKTVVAHLRADLPELARAAPLLGQPVGGAASLTAEVKGTDDRPRLDLNFSGRGMRLGPSNVEHLEADISASPAGVLNDPHTRVDIRGQGRIIGLALPEQAAAASGLGHEISWSLAATTTRDGRAVDLTQLSARGAGVSLAGSGQLAPTGAIEGRFNLSIADLRPFSSILGHPLDGSVELEASAAREGSAGFRAELDGSAKELKTGFAAADALLGGSATLAGSVRRDEAGVLSAHRLDVAGAAGKLTGDARFDPSSHSLAAALAFDLPRLAPLSSALGMPVSGALSARLKVEGPLARLAATGDVEGGDISLAGTRLDRLHLVAHVPDLSDPKAALQGSLHAYGLDGTLALAAEPKGNSELVVPQLQLTAADSTLAGSLRMALDTGLVRGAVSGRAPNLARWSGVAGRPLAGTIEFAAGLDAREGQLLDLSLTGTGLAEGSGPSRVGIGRLALTARFADILRRPSGKGRVSLASVNFNGGGFTTAALELDAPRPGRFSFRGDAKGEPLAVAMAGDGGLEPGKLDLRLTRLAGSLGSDRLFLEQPVSLSRNGADLAFSGLALAWGPGRISGNGGVRGQSVSLALNAADLPIASGARLLGYHNASGTLSIAATAGGTLRAPQGRLAVNARGLTLSTADHSKLPRLGLAVDGNWNGRNLDLKGQVTGLKGDNINFAGAVPLVFTPAPLGISMPPAGRLALQLQGAGQLENLADLLPLGEDRVSGRFAADVVVGGTVASPAANGRLKLSDARYENFASGAVLTKMQAEIIGDRDRFALSSFSATDNADGTLRAQGNVVLGGAAGPTAQLSATLTNFRVAARDEAIATASGAVSISGPLTAPHVTAPLTINRAEISLPDSLPPNVVVLNVVETNNKAGERQPPGTAGQPAALPMPLDITLDMPGNIFVRGHGLESEWRGKLAITGTSAAPNIKGSLTQVRGSIDLLGKTFTLTRGVITFDGSGKLDPVLDIVAESRASDITAQVNIGGSASAPRITLSSTPSVPKDEILSRVLFNRGVGQLSAAEGLQLAAAAGTLAGGGPGVLDRLRSGIGLDWFRLGSGAGGPASSTLNQTKTSGRGASNTALSAGKEIAPGVSVGVSQGLSPPTSKVTVDVEVRRHLTIQGEAGQAGTGIGLNYNFDY